MLVEALLVTAKIITKSALASLAAFIFFPNTMDMNVNMKTQGSFNFFHYFGSTSQAAADAEKQKQFYEKNKTPNSTKRGLVRAAPYIKEAPIAPQEANFPPLLSGIAFLRTNLAQWQPGVAAPPASEWKIFQQGEGNEALKIFQEIGDWHSGYRLKSGTVEFFQYPKCFGGAGSRRADLRFHTSTITLPAWDSKALSAALKNDDLRPQEMLELLDKMHRYLASDDHISAISCGAVRPLVYFMLFVHPQNGEFHIHPCYLKTTPLGFQKSDGSVLPRSGVPNRGRRKQGERWMGGERLGLIGSKGQLVTNPAGPSLCAADAMREEDVALPIRSGGNSDFLDDKLKRRTNGDVEKMQGAPNSPRMRDKGLGLPYDLLASRQFRSLVRELATKFPRFKAIRDNTIKHAHDKATADNEAQLRPFREEAALQSDRRLNEEQQKRIGLLKTHIIPLWGQIANLLMQGKVLRPTEIIRSKHASGRVLLGGRDEVEFLLSVEPDNRNAKKLLGYMNVRDEAFRMYDDEARNNGNESAERELRATESKWKCEYAAYRPNGSTGQLATTYSPETREDFQFLEELHWHVAKNGAKYLTPWMSTVITIDASGVPQFTEYLRRKLTVLNKIFVGKIVDREKSGLGVSDAIDQYLCLSTFSEKFGLKSTSVQELEDARKAQAASSKIIRQNAGSLDDMD